MKPFGKWAIGALMAGGAALSIATPAAARNYVGISFGFGLPGYASFGPCDYYDYYDAPPPWGLPPDYCDYNVYFQPVFWDGEWYRGPIYYRWERGRRVFWLNGRWRGAEWQHRPYNIQWNERGREHFRAYHGRRSYGHGGYYHHEREHYVHPGYMRSGFQHHEGYWGRYNQMGRGGSNAHHGNHEHGHGGDHHDHHGHF